jgi:AbrB family looped-hinge helix DNA binding protein
MLMVVRLSSKGQLVIPKPVRKELGLRTGTEFQLRLIDGKILLDPIISSPVDALYGKYAGLDLLAEQEIEHRDEVARDETLRS